MNTNMKITHPQSGTLKNLYSNYNFGNLSWTLLNPEYADVWRWMAHRLVRFQGKDFLVKNSCSERWCRIGSRDAAITDMMNMYGGSAVINGVTRGITREKITEYVKEYCLNVQGTLLIPMADELISFDNGVYVNTWQDSIKRARDGDERLAQPLLELVWHNLCGQTAVLSMDELLAAQRNPETCVEFYFLWHWLAAIYQKPGINLQTNIWLKGNEQGVGKGTFIGLLDDVFGGYLGKGSQTDWERGWTDFIEGKLIVECDEFNTSEKSDLKGKIQRDTSNTKLTINKRGTTPYEVPNVANWIFTTNADMPIWVNATDRRDTWIETGYGQQCIDRVRDFYRILGTDRAGIVAALTWLLATLDVDFEFLNRAPNTTAKIELVESHKHPVDYWVDNDTNPLTLRSEFLLATELFHRYTIFSNEYQKNTTCTSMTAFARRMRDLVKAGKVIMGVRKALGQQYKLPELDGSFIRTDNVVELNARARIDKLTKR